MLAIFVVDSLSLSLLSSSSLPFPVSFFSSFLPPSPFSSSSISITMAATNGTPANDFTVKAGLAQMLKGGVIMDVVNAEQVGDSMHWMEFPG